MPSKCLQNQQPQDVYQCSKGLPESMLLQNRVALSIAYYIWQNCSWRSHDTHVPAFTKINNMQFVCFFFSFPVLCWLSMTSFISCCLSYLASCCRSRMFKKKKRKKKKPHWRIEWLSLGWQLLRLKYLLTDCFLAELHQLWHQPGTQRETLVSTILSPATAVHPALRFTDQLITHSWRHLS